MIYLATSAAVVLVATGLFVARLRVRPAITPLPPREPFVFAHVRVLHDEREVREVAARACAREQRILDAAQRRAARFGELTRERSVPLPQSKDVSLPTNEDHPR
jgi:hypothetical protein